jgi:hypothetical protein
VVDWPRDMARDFNRSMPRGGLIDIRMEVKTSPQPRPVIIREDLLRNLECEICRRAYGPPHQHARIVFAVVIAPSLI